MIAEVNWEELATLIGVLATSIVSIITALKGRQIHNEVKTMNERTLGQLGADNETRRIEDIDPQTRTAREQRHMEH
jgi:hypothetical protein